LYGTFEESVEEKVRTSGITKATNIARYWSDAQLNWNEINVLELRE
jgi:hypothetical protein